MVIEKPWGREIIFAHTDKYVGKILEINKDQKLSLQHHELKDETIYIQKGTIKFIHGDNLNDLREAILTAGRRFRIRPGLIHRMIALEDSIILEASTPELDDVVRHQDEYGRANV